jgi:hypothetical protein
MGKQDANTQKVYDDDLVRSVSEEFSDRISTLFVIGDAIRALRGGSISHKEISPHEFIRIALDKITSNRHIFRERGKNHETHFQRTWQESRKLQPYLVTR